MARLTFAELVQILEAQSNYAQIARGVDARNSLVISFGPGSPTDPASDVLEAVDGKEIVINRTRGGRVTSIEIQ